MEILSEKYHSLSSFSLWHLQYIYNDIYYGILHFQQRCFWKVSLNLSLCDPPDGLMRLPQHMEDIQYSWETVISSVFRLQSLTEITHRQERTVSFQHWCVRAEKWKMLSWCMEWKQKALDSRTWWKPMFQRFSLFGWWCFFFLSLIFLWGTFKDACCPAALRSGPLTLDKMDPLYQSPAQPRRGESDATNNIITALVHISLIWQQPSLTSIPLTRSHTPLLGFIIIM